VNKVVFITGATRGIGKQIAITFAENGYDIALNYRTQNEELEKVKQEQKENSPAARRLGNIQRHARSID